MIQYILQLDDMFLSLSHDLDTGKLVATKTTMPVNLSPLLRALFLTLMALELQLISTYGTLPDLSLVFQHNLQIFGYFLAGAYGLVQAEFDPDQLESDLLWKTMDAVVDKAQHTREGAEVWAALANLYTSNVPEILTTLPSTGHRSSGTGALKLTDNISRLVHSLACFLEGRITRQNPTVPGVVPIGCYEVVVEDG